MKAEEYARQVCDYLPTATFQQAMRVYLEINAHKDMPKEVIAELGRRDRFYLFTHLLNRSEALHPWLYERCREVEASPDGHIDIWAR